METYTASAIGQDVILTGIARSGTTLACTLLNRLPDTVALHEPMSPRILMGASVPEGVNHAVSGFFAAQRRSLSDRREASSRTIEGRIPEDPYAADPGPNGLRSSQVRERVVRFDKPLSPEFRLIVKHPSCFTALLGSLKQRFPCHAVVRNPLAILLSWQTTEANWNDGRQPAAEAFDDDLRRRLDAEPDRLGRQLVMLSWSFGQYARHLPAERVIRYEDLVATGGRALVGVAPAADRLSESLHSRNANPLYGRVAVESIVERLLASPGPQWDFYPHDAVRDLASVLVSRPGSAERSSADG
jgi:hypothetical protein